MESKCEKLKGFYPNFTSCEAFVYFVEGNKSVVLIKYVLGINFEGSNPNIWESFELLKDVAFYCKNY